jgi:hypothetical protein
MEGATVGVALPKAGTSPPNVQAIINNPRHKIIVDKRFLSMVLFLRI